VGLKNTMFEENKISNGIKCLITGGAGFIGSHVVDKLIQGGHSVCVIDNLSTGRKENLNSKAAFYKADVSSPKIFKIFEKEKPEIVFHLAAQIDVRKSVESPEESAKTNILGSLNVLENCKNFGVKKFVFASTGGAIYGEADVVPTSEDYSPKPISPYGIEKLVVEHYLNFYKNEHGLDSLILRFANVYGPRQNSKGEAGVVAIFADKMLSKEQPVINGDGKNTRDFVFVEDVAKACMLGFEKSGTFNIGTAKETDVNTVFTELRNLLNSEAKEVHVQAKLGEQRRSCLDIKKAKEVLDWTPEYDLSRGLKLTANWFNEKN